MTFNNKKINLRIRVGRKLFNGTDRLTKLANALGFAYYDDLVDAHYNDTNTDAKLRLLDGPHGKTLLEVLKARNGK